MRLSEALRLRPGDIVAIVGGGGKTTAMFRLAQEIVQAGGRVITTTTTRIFAAQVALAPAHLREPEATPERVAAMLDAFHHVLITGIAEAESGKALGVSVDFVRVLQAHRPSAILIEADGSRMRPFKAPAEHEPVIPLETTLVVPVVGADVLGQPLTAKHVHRPELVSALSETRLGTRVTPAAIARVITHPQGGLKGIPPGARVVPLINKLDLLADAQPAHEAARLLLQHPAIHHVVLGAVKQTEPVLACIERTHAQENP